jgi:hypothetical protein
MKTSTLCHRLFGAAFLFENAEVVVDCARRV